MGKLGNLQNWGILVKLGQFGETVGIWRNWGILMKLGEWRAREIVAAVRSPRFIVVDSHVLTFTMDGKYGQYWTSLAQIRKTFATFSQYVLD